MFQTNFGNLAALPRSAPFPGRFQCDVSVRLRILGYALPVAELVTVLPRSVQATRIPNPLVRY
jgi:hypothetical protein